MKRLLNIICCLCFPILIMSSCSEDLHDAIVKLRKKEIPDSYPVRIVMTPPDNTLPDYPATQRGARSQKEEGYALRSVVELCRGRDDIPVVRINVNPEIMPDGRLLVEFDAPLGAYGLMVWTDRTHTDRPTDDCLYDTSTLNSVSIFADPYQAGVSLRDASYYYGELNHDRELTELEITLERPLAKYRLMANDVSRYNELRDKYPDKYPPLSDLTVEVAYEYFFPSVFNVISRRPVDSATGVSYNSVLEEAAGFPADKAVMIAHDCVLTNGSDSFVSLTVKVCAADGKEVASSSGIRVDYRRGYLTTVKGNFLTAGKTTGSGGVSIDTEWENEIIIEF